MTSAVKYPGPESRRASQYYVVPSSSFIITFLRELDYVPNTVGLNYLGPAVRDRDRTRDLFVRVLGWSESGRDDS